MKFCNTILKCIEVYEESSLDIYLRTLKCINGNSITYSHSLDWLLLRVPQRTQKTSSYFRDTKWYYYMISLWSQTIASFGEKNRYWTKSVYRPQIKHVNYIMSFWVSTKASIQQWNSVSVNSAWMIAIFCNVELSEKLHLIRTKSYFPILLFYAIVHW